MKRSMLIVAFAALGLLPISSTMAQFGPTLAGITVTGTGIATGDAETARFMLFLVSQSMYVGPPQVPVVEATPGAGARAKADPVLMALQGADGVNSATVVIPSYQGAFSGINPVAILNVTMTAPTQDNVAAMIGSA